MSHAFTNVREQCFFSFPMQRFSIELWNVIACIAVREGVAMELQILRPYGAGSVVRC